MKKCLAAFLLLHLFAFTASAAVHADSVESGNLAIRVELPVSSNTRLNLVSFPLCGYNITGADGATGVHLNEAISPLSYPFGTRVYFYNPESNNYTIYQNRKDSIDWVRQDIVDGDAGVNLPVGPDVNVLTIERTGVVWIEFPEDTKPEDRKLVVLGQLPVMAAAGQVAADEKAIEGQTLTIAEHISPKKSSRNLIGFGTLKEVVLYGQAENDQFQAEWGFKPIRDCTQRYPNNRYQIIVPTLEGVDRTYTVSIGSDGKPRWKVYGYQDPGRIVLPAGKGFWVFNPSADSITVKVANNHRVH